MATVTDDVARGIAAVRSDSDPVDWCVAGYEDKTTIKLLGMGSGGIAELKQALVDRDVCYGFLRKQFEWESVGGITANTVKFVFVYWRPDGIPISRKMKMGIYEGQMKRQLSPYHVVLEAAVQDEVTEAAVMDLIGSVTMRSSNVTDKKATGMYVAGATVNSTAAPGKGESSGASASSGSSSSSGGGGGAAAAAAGGRGGGFLGAAAGSSSSSSSSSSSNTGRAVDNRAAAIRPAQGAQLKFDDLQALTAAVEDVRNDLTPTRWCLFGYRGKQTLALVDTGPGDVEEMKACFQSGNVNYGLFRVTEQFDAQVKTTTKFCFVTWQPDDVHPVKRGVFATHKAAVNAVFDPFQYTFFVTDPAEFSGAMVAEHISGLTGTRSHVTDKVATGMYVGGKTIVASSEEKEKKVDNMCGMSTEGVEATFVDEDGGGGGGAAATRAAMQRIRREGTDGEWMAVTYDTNGPGGAAKPRLRLACAAGDGGVEGLRAFVAGGGGGGGSGVFHALLRTSETIDRSVTVKFSFITLIPEDGLHPKLRGAIGVRTGSVDALFSPYHGSIMASVPADLTVQAVDAAVRGLRRGNSSAGITR